jgi:Flp pilus assembly protein TadG
MFSRHVRRKGKGRRGTVAALTAISSVALLGFVALAVDVGMLYNVRAELQRTADAAALAAAWELLDEDALSGTPEMSLEEQAARQAAATYAALNSVHNANPAVDLNAENTIEGDIVLGYLSNPNNLSQPLCMTAPNQINSVRVLVRRDSVRNGPISLFFANVLGISTCELSASATATIKDGVVGYRVTEETGPAELLPMALKKEKWDELLTGVAAGPIGDDYSYDEETGAVTSGADGILELNLFPGEGPDQLPPGNYGTVDIGGSNNSTADIARQILEGVNADDLAYHGGELKLGSDGTLLLEGDTGISASLKNELKAIIGQPRAIPLFSEVSGPGDNSIFTIVGFAGMRIVDVKLTGAMELKSVIIQPANVVDDSTITEEGPGSSYFVYETPRLTR